MMIGSLHPHGAPAVLLIVCLATGAVATSVLGAPPSAAHGASAPNSGSGNPGPQGGPPNILFIIMDDVGIDQLHIFNSGALDLETPMIDEIAANGVMFQNFWTMPECSPSRACIFTGRYPFRTGVNAAILDEDQPRAQVSPFEVTAPRVLDHAGYRSALIGKFHLGDINPAMDRSPAALGWDYFNGILPGVPPDIDTTLGEQIDADGSPYSCGFPAGTDLGVCWFQGPGNQEFCDDNDGQGYTGLDCVTAGGIPALIPAGESGAGTFATTCEQAGSEAPDFEKQSAYYVWPKVIVQGQGPQSFLSRTYMTVDQTDGAIDWIQQQTGPHGAIRPWMCTVSYNSGHTPFQQPPVSLTSGSDEITDCDNSNHDLSNLMIEAMDTEIARLLVSTGLAVQEDGDVPTLILEESNTVVIVVGDNGTYFEAVKDPYDPLGAKGTPYQTGVLTPLIIAGPSAIVHQPDRKVDHMVSCVDLFELFGEIAGLDVHDIVPASHVLDSKPLLPYLLNPDQGPLRQFMFTQLGDGLKSKTGVEALGPCVLALFNIQGDSIPSCNDILFTSESLCEANGGTWFGAESALDVPDCCSLCRSTQNPFPNLTIEPRGVMAITNFVYKLVKQDLPCCKQDLPCPSEPGETEVFSTTFELYITNGGSLDTGASLDTQEDNLLHGICPDQLAEPDLENFNQLRDAMFALLETEIACEGDGNLDKRVDIQDFVGVMQNLNSSSVFDMNSDGVTDGVDLMCVLNNMGNVCSALDAGEQCEGITGACWVAAEDTCKIVTEADCMMDGGVNWLAGTIHCCPCVDTADCPCP